MRAKCWWLENKLKKMANITAHRSEMCFQSLTAESKLFKLFIYFVMSQQLYCIKSSNSVAEPTSLFLGPHHNNHKSWQQSALSIQGQISFFFYPFFFATFSNLVWLDGFSIGCRSVIWLDQSISVVALAACLGSLPKWQVGICLALKCFLKPMKSFLSGLLCTKVMSTICSAWCAELVSLIFSFVSRQILVSSPQKTYCDVLVRDLSLQGAECKLTPACPIL